MGLCTDLAEANMYKTQRHAYLCDGKPDCYGIPGCGLIGRGECKHTTDLEYAINRLKLVKDGNFYRRHMRKVADSGSEEWWMEE